jgi:hypothetical protein
MGFAFAPSNIGRAVQTKLDYPHDSIHDFWEEKKSLKCILKSLAAHSEFCIWVWIKHIYSRSLNNKYMLVFRSIELRRSECKVRSLLLILFWYIFWSNVVMKEFRKPKALKVESWNPGLNPIKLATAKPKFWSWRDYKKSSFQSYKTTFST